MKTEMTKDFKKSVQKYGSVLKAFRSQGGGSLGVFAGGVTLLIFGIVLGLLALLGSTEAGIVVLLIFGGPGLLMIVFGKSKHKKRMANYLEFFQKETGYSLEDLQQADRELMGPEALTLICTTDRSAGKKETVFFVTDHYFVSAWPVNGCYLRKLEDIVAAFYSSQIPGIGGYCQNLFLISRQDIQQKGLANPFTDKQYRGFENRILTNNKHCRDLCNEVVAEIARRAPHVITSQNIVVKGEKYNLLSMEDWQGDWARILEG